MPSVDERIPGIVRIAERIVPVEVWRLFLIFCREILRLSHTMSIEVAPFEVRFHDTSGFLVRVLPYRELFVVSLGAPSQCDVRVSTTDGYISALDIALQHFLAMRSSSKAKGISS